MPNQDATRELLLVSVPEAARRLGVSTRKTWSLLAGGDLEPVHVGQRTLVRIADLVEFVARGGTGGRRRRSGVR